MERCDCFPPTLLDDSTSTRRAKPTTLLADLDDIFKAESEGFDEYALLHPDLMGGSSFLRPEVGKLAISTAVAKDLYKEARAKMETGSDILASTRAMLLINGDNYSAWNVRKRVLTQATLTLASLEGEIQFTTLVFSVRHKSTNAWSHRRWACRAAELMFKSHLEESPTSFWARELEVCEAVAERHPKNYFAWTHRLAICRLLDKESIELEVNRSNEFLRRHVSDRSAAHHCEQLLSLRLGRSSSLREQLEFGELQLEFGATLAETLPGHETLWHHLRTCMRIFLSIEKGPLRCEDPGILSRACSLISSSAHHDKDEPQEDKYELIGSIGSHGTTPMYLIISRHLGLASRVMHGPAPSWGDEATQRRCAAAFAFDVCVHCSKRSKDPDSNWPQKSIVDAARKLCSQLSEPQRGDGSSDSAPHQSHYSGPASQHLDLWASLASEIDRENYP